MDFVLGLPCTQKGNDFIHDGPIPWPIFFPTAIAMYHVAKFEEIVKLYGISLSISIAIIHFWWPSRAPYFYLRLGMELKVLQFIPSIDGWLDRGGQSLSR